MRRGGGEEGRWDEEDEDDELNQQVAREHATYSSSSSPWVSPAEAEMTAEWRGKAR